MIKAILMDLDGVLVDACSWHYIAFNMALKHVVDDEINLQEHYTTFNGLPTKTKLEILLTQGRITQKDVDKIWKLKQEMTKRAIKENASVNNDIIALHQQLTVMGMSLVCVTNSITETASLMLDKTGQLSFMAFIITNEMVNNPKPHPEGYIRAMIRLGVMPDECIIVEDSDKGLTAARATGAHVCHVLAPCEVAEKLLKMIGDLNEIRKT